MDWRGSTYWDRPRASTKSPSHAYAPTHALLRVVVEVKFCTRSFPFQILSPFQTLIVIFAHLIAAAVVGFVEQFITVIEGDLQAVLEVAILSGSLQRDLVLNLTLNDGSAFRTYNYVVLLLHNESAANLRDIVLGFQNNVQ